MRTQLPLALLLALPATLPLAACATDGADPADDPILGEPTTEDVTAALALENGGFATTDEAPEFGDAALFSGAELESDAAVQDAVAADPQYTALERDPAAAARTVIVMWGQLPADPTAAARTWDGELRVSRGGMVVRRRIAFEDRADRLLPRTRRDTVAFQSVTRGHADGLALTVIDPKPADPAALTLTYTSADAAATYSIDLSKLADGPVVIDAGGGAKLIAIAHRRTDACEHGFMRGRWRQLTPNVGHYAGYLLDADGARIGHVRGIYGQRPGGEPVFFGKLINREGGFRGLMRGTFGEGKFEGRWLDRTGDRGVTRGVYIPGAALRAGHFLGRWAERTCDAP
jgi:hypothetical protein